MDEYSFFALHSNEGRFRQTVGESSEELTLANLPLTISFHEPLQLHTHALRLRRDYIRKIIDLMQPSTVSFPPISCCP